MIGTETIVQRDNFSSVFPWQREAARQDPRAPTTQCWESTAANKKALGARKIK